MTGTPSRRTILQAVGAAGLVSVAGCTTPTTTPSTPVAAPSTTAAQPLPSATTAPATSAAAPAVLRFATASDGHLGQKGTDSRRYLTEFVTALNAANTASAIDLAVINGDIGHGGKALLVEAKAGLDQLDMPYLVTQGNHDKVGPATWRTVWGTPENFVHRIGDRSLVLANTSNAAGEYLCADTSWLEGALAGEAGQRDVLVFMHITPNTWTKFGVACPQVRRILAAAPNVRAVFNGHDHDQAGVKVDEGVHYVFDAHYGGDWGTSYRAFRVVEVDGTRLTTWLVTVAGKKRAETTITW